MPARVLLHIAVEILAPTGRIVLALDDTPSQRYGPKVEGAGLHHNPTPGPAGSRLLYGHNWVTLAWVVRHPLWGAIGLPLLARTVRAAQGCEGPMPGRAAAGVTFRTKLVLAGELLAWAARWLAWAGASSVDRRRWRLCQAAVPARCAGGAGGRGQPATQGCGPGHVPATVPAGQRPCGRPRIYMGSWCHCVRAYPHVVGELSTLFVILHVSVWVVLVGLTIALLGVRGARTIAFPLGYLLTVIPLPMFLYANLSSQLQLWSSSLGVGCLQLVAMAFREGNIIDLGPVQLQVVEACSGIRYLLPLTSLALLSAYLFKDKMWKRVVLVLSSIPISILINGFRIGMIGVLVELYGKGAAEGFYHLFEGWVIFMVSLALLILEMGLLGTIRASIPGKPFFERFTWRDQAGDTGREGRLEDGTRHHGISRPRLFVQRRASRAV